MGIIGWVLKLLVILSDWGEIHGSLERSELENGEEKMKISSDKHWGTAPTRTPKDSIYP